MGLFPYLEQYTQAKKGERSKRKIDSLLKATIWRLREENRNCCGQKITEYLKEETGIYLSPKSVYKVLGEKYKLRTKWKKNIKRGPVPKASKPREVVQMDTVDFGEVFAFTGIDIFSKDISVKLYPDLTSKEGLDFLVASFEKRFKHTFCKQLADLSLKMSSSKIYTNTPIGLGWPGLTERINRHT